MLRRLTCLVLLFVLCLAPSASALIVRTTDPNDTRGTFDLEAVAQGAYDHGQYDFLVVTHGKWRDKELRTGRISLRFDTDESGFYDTFLILRYKKGRLRARIEDGAGRFIAKANISSRADNKVLVRALASEIGIRPGFYRMSVVAKDWGSSCTAKPCIDRLPNDGSIRHRTWPPCFGVDPDVIGTSAGEIIRVGGPRPVLARGGDDRIVVKRSASAGIVCGGRGADVVVGNRRSDLLAGGPGRDRIEGRGAGGGAGAEGRNEILGGQGRDWLLGGYGIDLVFGDAGNDHIEGRRRADKLVGGPGVDDLDGGGGNDRCLGGERLHAC